MHLISVMHGHSGTLVTAAIHSAALSIAAMVLVLLRKNATVFDGDLWGTTDTVVIVCDCCDVWCTCFLAPLSSRQLWVFSMLCLLVR